MSTAADKLAYLAETKAMLRDAISAKGADVPIHAAFREYPEKIAQIETGVVLEPLANPASHDQILLGYQAYDNTGSLIEGMAQSYQDGYTQGYTDGSGGVGPPQPLSYDWDPDTLTLTIVEV